MVTVKSENLKFKGEISKNNHKKAQRMNEKKLRTRYFFWVISFCRGGMEERPESPQTHLLQVNRLGNQTLR